MNGWLLIPAGELHERFSRSSGPGGQSVNTADSRVELSFDVAHSAALPAYARERILARLSGRLADGVLTVIAAEQRSQMLNLVGRARPDGQPDPGGDRPAAAAPHPHPARPRRPRAPGGRQTPPGRDQAVPPPRSRRHRLSGDRPDGGTAADDAQPGHDSAGSSVSDTELMHQRWSVGTSKPSPLEHMPQVGAHRLAQRTSVRTMPSVRSLIKHDGVCSLDGW